MGSPCLRDAQAPARAGRRTYLGIGTRDQRRLISTWSPGHRGSCPGDPAAQEPIPLAGGRRLQDHGPGHSRDLRLERFRLRLGWLPVFALQRGRRFHSQSSAGTTQLALAQGRQVFGRAQRWNATRSCLPTPCSQHLRQQSQPAQQSQPPAWAEALVDGVSRDRRQHRLHCCPTSYSEGQDTVSGNHLHTHLGSRCRHEATHRLRQPLDLWTHDGLDLARVAHRRQFGIEG